MRIRPDKAISGTTRRGGARSGSGRPRKTVSAEVRDKILLVIEAEEKRSGEGFWGRLIWIAAESDQPSVRLAAYGLLLDILVTRRAQSEVKVMGESSVAIMLPEQMPDLSESDSKESSG